MTIETQTNREQYIGNGVTTDFPVPFPVLQPDHLRLFLWQNNRQTEMTGGFVVIGAGTASVSVRTLEPVAVGVKLTILREVPLKQEMDLMNGGHFNAEILEGSADILVMLIQQLSEKADRAIVAPESFGSNEVTYETLAGLKDDAESARDQATASAGEASEDAARAAGAADLAETTVQEIKRLKASANSLEPGAEAAAHYDPATGILTLGIPEGRKGEKGEDGKGINILDAFDDVSELPATGNPGEGYMVGADLYVWSAADNIWKNAGPIQGPPGDKGDKGDTGAAGPKGDDAAAGEIRLLSFRPAELPFGWYFANGDQYPLSSPQGMALNTLSANYKTDWGIAAAGGNINLPSLFYSDGRGFFLRAANASARALGSSGAQGDAIRNITGRVSYYDGSNAAAVFYTPEGAFSGESNVIRPNRVSGSAAVSSIFGVLRFNASSQVPTAGENRPLNIGMTPAIYLGV